MISNTSKKKLNEELDDLRLRKQSILKRLDEVNVLRDSIIADKLSIQSDIDAIKADIDAV